MNLFKMQQGLQNEYDIIETINGKKLRDLPQHFKDGFIKMYKYVNENDVVHAEKISNRTCSKPDIKVELSNHDKYMNISIKSGWMPSLHQEDLWSFMDFLKSLNISSKTLNTVLFYHYADETYDGTGVNKMRFDNFREKYKKMIAEASDELSQEHIVTAVVNRAIVVGRYENGRKINYLYHGTKDSGFFIHRNDILDHAFEVGRPKYTALHFGPIVYVAKVPNKLDSTGNKHHYAQLIWPKIDEDLKKILNYCEPEKMDFHTETKLEKIKKWWKEFKRKYLS
jgi:hypothetical protein